MAKFVKLEDGNYINVDFISYIGVRDDDCQIYTTDDLNVWINATKTDVDNILKAKNDNGGEKKISKETLKIAINAMKKESADLGSQAGFALETDAPGAESYYRDCEEQDAILREAIDELEEYGGVHFGGIGSKLDNELKERGLQ